MSDPVTAAAVCPTCGPTKTEQHPRRAGVIRCANCKEWLTPVTAAVDGSPDPRSGMVAALAEVLGAHQLVERGRVYDRCSCGWYGSWPTAHVAAALVPTVERLAAEGRAEALEGAAANIDMPTGTRRAIRARAAAVVREGDDR